MANPLFTPLEIGTLGTFHRVVLAPLTRLRAEEPQLTVRHMHADYYGAFLCDLSAFVAKCHCSLKANP